MEHRAHRISRWYLRQKEAKRLLATRPALKKAGFRMPTQYHASSWDRAASILQKGLQLPRRSEDVATHRYATPSISTADNPDDARPYHPRGALFEVKVSPGAKYQKRSFRTQSRRGESFEDTVNRWLKEAASKGFDGIYVSEWQSTVGNQTINPKAFASVRLVNPEDAPVGFFRS